MDPFYAQLDEHTFASSPSTAAPWGPDRQHAGPPSALLARAIERFEPREDHRLGRVNVDILGAVPVAPLRVTVERLRTGRRLELFEAKAEAERPRRAGRPCLAGGQDAGRLPVPPRAPARFSPTDLPAAEPVRWDGMYLDGYVSAMDFRFERSSFEEFGPGMAWGRQRVPLVDGEEPTPWQRVLVLADSGNGISLALDPNDTRRSTATCP